jgi:hypothetical protein
MVREQKARWRDESATGPVLDIASSTIISGGVLHDNGEADEHNGSLYDISANACDTDDHADGRSEPAARA